MFVIAYEDNVFTVMILLLEYNFCYRNCHSFCLH